MKIRVKDKTPLRFVGLKQAIALESKNPFDEIVSFWDALAPSDQEEMLALSSEETPCLYGLSTMLEDDGYFYWIAVQSDKPAPDGWEVLEIAASSWAIFEVEGAIAPQPSPIQEAMAFAIDRWLPQSKYQQNPAIPLSQIEQYPDDDIQKDSYTSQLWIAVEEK